MSNYIIKKDSKELHESIWSLDSKLRKIRNGISHSYSIKELGSFKPIIIDEELLKRVNSIDWAKMSDVFSSYKPYYISSRRRKPYSSNKRLENLRIEELIFKISKLSAEDDEYLRIQSLITKKTFALWLEKKLKKLKKILKLLLNDSINQFENKREFFRKINSFYFKNLDDTHSVIAFN